MSVLLTSSQILDLAPRQDPARGSIFDRSMSTHGRLQTKVFVPGLFLLPGSSVNVEP